MEHKKHLQNSGLSKSFYMVLCPQKPYKNRWQAEALEAMARNSKLV